MTPTKITAPWLKQQVKALNRFQHSRLMHPFTCGNDRTDRAHLDGEGRLIAIESGWICPFCDYEQDWAHSFMLTITEDYKQNLNKQLLKPLIQNLCFKTGEFTLTSGQKSGAFFDLKQATLNPLGQGLISKIIMQMIENHDIDAVGGLATGACPIVSGLVALSNADENCESPLLGFYVRKTVKEHGTKQRIEGLALNQGHRVLIVDDVATSGGSLLSSIAAVEETGASVIKVITVVDREQGAKAKLAQEGYKLESIFTANELEIAT